jgi:CelD/BcsL family acetyltransferase involved in cellulose biosynthesis
MGALSGTITALQQSCLPSAAYALPVVRADRGGVELIDRFADEWHDLCRDARDDQPFFHPEWVGAYLRTFFPSARLLVITARVKNTLSLILPLMEETGTFSKIPVRRLRVPVNSTSGRFDAICRVGPMGDAALRATWNFLRDLRGWNVLQFFDSLDGSAVSRIVEMAIADGFRTVTVPDRPNPVIRVPSDPAQLQKMPPNSKLRSQLRQIRHRVQQAGRLTFCRTTEATPEALERFYRLEASGWKAHSGSCALTDGSRPFYDQVMQAAAHRGLLSLYTLELNGNLIAAHMSLVHRDRCYSPKVAYNEDYKPFAPGHLMIAEILQDCFQRGIKVFDITGQDQPWKLKWTSECRQVSHHYIFKGRLGSLAHAVGSRVRPPQGSSWS